MFEALEKFYFSMDQFLGSRSILVTGAFEAPQSVKPHLAALGAAHRHSSPSLCEGVITMGRGDTQKTEEVPYVSREYGAKAKTKQL